MNQYQWYLKNNYVAACRVVITSYNGVQHYDMQPGQQVSIPLYGGYKYVTSYDTNQYPVAYYPINVSANGRYIGAAMWWDGSNWYPGSGSGPQPSPDNACSGMQAPI
jgi:hypothetical protein